MSNPRVMGYARVSSTGQNLDRQILALRKYVPEENIVVDKQSGKDLERPGYQALKGVLGLRPGDILYIKSLDRLSRNKQDIREELRWFKDNGVTLRILDLPTTMADFGEGQEWIREMVTNILIEVMSSLAEQERMTISKRQREGIEAAKLNGKHLGRPVIVMPVDFPTVYRKWQQGEITAVYAMQSLGLKRGTFYRMAAEYKRIMSEKALELSDMTIK